MGNFEQLVLELHSYSDTRRGKAAEALRQQGEPGGQLSAETLIQILQHDTIPLRIAAANILREWGGAVPIEPLLLALQDADVRVRPAIQWAIAEVGKYARQEYLLPHLTASDTRMRAAVILALGTRTPIPAVLQAICDPDEGVREAAVLQIGQLRDQIPVELLISELQSQDAGRRATAAIALGTLEAQIPVAPLVRALHDPEEAVRLAATRALANTGPQLPRAALRSLLDDANHAIRQAALKALARIGDPTALARIVDSLHADHEWKRETALQHLVEGTNEERHEIARQLPIEELLHLLTDAWWPVGYMAAGLIAMLGKHAPLADILALLSHPLPQARWAALSVLALLGEHHPLSQLIPIEPVLNALEADDAETRRGAVSILEDFGPVVPVGTLLPLIEDGDTRIAHILAKRGRQEGIDALVASLRTRDHAWHAAKAIGDLGKHAPAEPLLAALSTSNTTVRYAVAEALYKTHPEFLVQLVPELVETLCSGQGGPLLEPLRPVLLVRALAALHSPLPALLVCFDQSLDAPNWEVRMWAALGLSWMTPKVFEAPIEKLRHLLDDPESASVRKAAHYALEHLVPHTTELQPE